MKTTGNLVAFTMIIVVSAWLGYGMRPGKVRAQVVIPPSPAKDLGPIKIAFYDREQVAAFASNRLALIQLEAGQLQTALLNAQLKFRQAQRANEKSQPQRPAGKSKSGSLAATNNNPASLVEANNVIRNIENQISQLHRLQWLTASLSNTPLHTFTIEPNKSFTIPVSRWHDYAIYAAPVNATTNLSLLPVWFLYLNESDFRNGLVLSYHNLLTNHYTDSVFHGVLP